MCRLNAKTFKDAHPISRIAESLETQHGVKWFCSLDLQRCFLQVGVYEVDKAKTAVITPFRLFEFNRMPFGLTNALSTFQRLMKGCLSVLNLKICLVYMDDVVVSGSTFKETLERLQTVLRRLSELD